MARGGDGRAGGGRARVRRAGHGVARALRVELRVDEQAQTGDADEQRGVADESQVHPGLHGIAT